MAHAEREEVDKFKFVEQDYNLSTIGRQNVMISDCKNSDIFGNELQNASSINLTKRVKLQLLTNGKVREKSH